MRVENPGGPNAVTIDPDEPVYQVEIFTRLSEPADLPEDERSYRVSEWKLHDADVVEVLAWAADKAAGRPYTVSVAAAETGPDAYRLHLFGQNPLRHHIGGGPYTLAPDVLPDLPG